MPETYLLIEGYVRRAGEGKAAPREEYNNEEDLVTDREWDDIPYFRKPFFLIVTFLIFMPGYLILIWSGDTYYRKEGVVYRTSSKTRRRTTVCAVFLMASYFLRRIG
jgi:hypothetical protein